MNTPLASVEDVGSFYDVFPYPTITTISRPTLDGFKRGTLDYLMRRRHADRLPADAQIWVAGCGTQQALHWAMCFPKGKVLATDISERSLAQSADLAKQLELGNLELAKQDLMQPQHREQFDLVVSTGVVHHLPDPAVGLANIAAAVKPSGAIVLMVYNRMHREPLAVFRRALETLAPPGMPHEARYALACGLLDVVLDEERCAPPCPGALQMLREKRDTDRPFVADCLLHPLEHTYDLDGLLALLEGAGLRLSSWLQPVKWRLDAHCSVPDLLARWEQLTPHEQWRAVYHVAGYAGPLFELVAEPSGTEMRAPYSDAELLAMPLAVQRTASAVKVEEGKVTAVGEGPTYRVEGDELVGESTGQFGSQHAWRLPAYAEPLLVALDGTRPTSEAAATFVEEYGSEAVVSVLRTLSPTDLGMLAPLF